MVVLVTKNKVMFSGLRVFVGLMTTIIVAAVAFGSVVYADTENTLTKLPIKPHYPSSK